MALELLLFSDIFHVTIYNMKKKTFFLTAVYYSVLTHHLSFL